MRPERSSFPSRYGTMKAGLSDGLLILWEGQACTIPTKLRTICGLSNPRRFLSGIGSGTDISDRRFAVEHVIQRTSPYAPSVQHLTLASSSGRITGSAFYSRSIKRAVGDKLKVGLAACRSKLSILNSGNAILSNGVVILFVGDRPTDGTLVQG